MANDPMTLSSVTTTTLRDGLCRVEGLATGPADYDNGTGALFDISAYLSTMPGGIDWGGCTGKTDALVYPMWVATAVTAVSTGVVFFTWSPDGVDGEVFKEVADGTAAALETYVWHFAVTGEPA